MRGPKPGAGVKISALSTGALTLRGFDPLNDAREYGRELIPIIRSKIAAVDARIEASHSDAHATA